jgi:hypothetical protein
MLCMEIIVVYSENHMKPVTQNVVLLIVKAGGTCSHYWTLKG